MLAPKRYIYDNHDLALFQSSKLHEDLLLFISSLNSSVRGKSATPSMSPFLERVVKMLSTLEDWLLDYPPIQQPMRYGNIAFRDWYSKMLREAEHQCASLLPEDCRAHALEVATYLCESFGNATRIDFGTGHELAFIFFLCSLCKLKLIAPEDLLAVGLRVIPAYLRLCRSLQRRYGLEPAGSHGVWCLDDYHFIVFILGSSQLVGHPHIHPRDALKLDVMQEFGKEYMYLDALNFICSVKRGAPFGEHSPLLASLAELPSWGRVNEELAKMFRAEVLGKVPVAQHFLFGILLPASWSPSREPSLSECGASLTSIHSSSLAYSKALRAPQPSPPRVPTATCELMSLETAEGGGIPRCPTATELGQTASLNADHTKIPSRSPLSPSARVYRGLSDGSGSHIQGAFVLARIPTATTSEMVSLGGVSPSSSTSIMNPIAEGGGIPRCPTATELGQTASLSADHTKFPSHPPLSPSARVYRGSSDGFGSHIEGAPVQGAPVLARIPTATEALIVMDLSSGSLTRIPTAVEALTDFPTPPQ